jgi:hypothetical protein
MKPSNNYVTRVFASSGLRRSPLLRGTLVVAPSQITCAGNEYHAVWKYGDAGDK